MGSYRRGIIIHTRIALFVKVYFARLIRACVCPAIGCWVVVVVASTVAIRRVVVVPRHAALRLTVWLALTKSDVANTACLPKRLLCALPAMCLCVCA